MLPLYKPYYFKQNIFLLLAESTYIYLLSASNKFFMSKIIVGRTRKEYKNDNTESIKAFSKQYKIDNKEKIKQYKIDNKESISIQSKQYYKINIESIKAKASLQYLCACGLTLRTDSKAKHNKSAKHLKALEHEVIII